VTCVFETQRILCCLRCNLQALPDRLVNNNRCHKVVCGMSQSCKNSWVLMIDIRRAGLCCVICVNTVECWWFDDSPRGVCVEYYTCPFQWLWPRRLVCSWDGHRDSVRWDLPRCIAWLPFGWYQLLSLNKPKLLFDNETAVSIVELTTCCILLRSWPLW